MISETIEIADFPKERLLRALTYTMCANTLPEPWRPDVWSDETETIWNTTNGLRDTDTNEFVDGIVGDFRPIFFNIQVSDDEFIFDVISVAITENQTGHTVRVSLLKPDIEGIEVRYLEILSCFHELRRIATRKAKERLTNETASALLEEVDLSGNDTYADKQLPPSPDVEGWNAVFDWYWANRDEIPNLKRLAEKIGYNYGTVRNQHTIYKPSKE